METLLVEKETIPSLSFNDKSKVKQHPNLRKQIDKATILGNTHRRKVSIVFEDDDEKKSRYYDLGFRYQVCLSQRRNMDPYQ